MPTPTAAVLIIGNEILSGRTKDLNLPFLGEQLAALGIRVVEARVVSDVESAIIEAVNTLRGQADYVFTTGGIGPTHDDITAGSIAKAFGTKLHLHPVAYEAFKKHYKPEDLNEARLRMAHVPEGAVLVENPVSVAPGFRLENVYVFAGIPRVMQAMFQSIRHELNGGPAIKSRTISAFMLEGTIAAKLEAIQQEWPQVDIGSYPTVKDNRFATSLVLRSHDHDALDAAYVATQKMVQDFNVEIISEQ